MKRGYMDQSAVRIFNQTQMVNMIREDDQLTTARIARRMGLSPPAVSNNIAELIERGVIVKAGQQKRPKEPGRKGELLAVNPVYSHIIAADLSGRRLIAGACDFSNKVLLTKIGDAIVGKEAGNILNQIIKIVDAIILETRLSAEQLGAIVISAPGIIDPETGSMMLAPQFRNWESTNLRNALRERYSAEIIVKNDISVRTIGEQKQGIGQYYESFVHINVDLGVGAGIVMDGKLIEGAHNASGEIGYSITDWEAHPSPAHGIRYLENEISFIALFRHLGLEFDDFHESDAFDYIQTLFAKRDPKLMWFIDSVSEKLAILIANINALLDVSAFSLDGAVMRTGHPFADSISSLLAGVFPRQPTVLMSSLGQDGYLGGAFVLGAHSIIENAIRRGQSGSLQAKA